MTPMELIKTRKSVRTFDGRPLGEEDKAKLLAYTETITNPYGIPVTFVLLDADELGLSTPVITGEHLYIAAKVPQVEHAAEAFGYAFEAMVLYAWSLGIGTTWIGGTMERQVFEAAAQTGDDEFMMCVSPLGYPADEPAEVDAKLRAGVKGDERLPASDLYFEGDFATPLQDADALALLEAVRWAPTAANKQPCRVVKDGNAYHFYEAHTPGYGAGRWDIQRVDLGIALCHFVCVAGGAVSFEDPGLATPEDVDYIATVTI